MRRQRKHRLGVAGTKRPGPADVVEHGDGRARGRDRAIDLETILVARLLDRVVQRLLQESAEGRELVGHNGDAGRHGVAAALDEQTRGDGMAHRAADIDAGDRASRAGADAARLQRNRESGPAIALLQPRGDEADDARMPALPRRDDNGALLFDAERGHRLGLGLRERRLLDGLALAVEPVELGGHRAGLGWVVFEQEARAEVGTADASARIDARPEQKAQVPAFRRSGEPRRVHQCGQADMLAAAHRDQPLRDEGAVEPLERHDVGNGAERHKVERVEQVGLRAQHVPEAALAQLAVDGDYGHEHEADRRQMVEPRQIILPVRVDQCVDRRQGLVRLMMVDRHHVEAERLRLHERLDAGRAAIDRDQELRALLGERAHRFGVRDRSLRTAGRGCGSAAPVRSGAGISRAPPPRSRRRRHSRRRSRSSRAARSHRRCAPPLSACRSACPGPASAAAPSDRETPAPRRPRHRARRARARAAPTRRGAAPSRWRAPRRAHRAARARCARTPSAPRRGMRTAFR